MSGTRTAGNALADCPAAVLAPASVARHVRRCRTRTNNLCASRVWPALLTDAPIRRMTVHLDGEGLRLASWAERDEAAEHPDSAPAALGCRTGGLARRSGPGAGEGGGAMAAADKADYGLDNAWRDARAPQRLGVKMAAV
jgi:hypothetical protein